MYLAKLVPVRFWVLATILTAVKLWAFFDDGDKREFRDLVFGLLAIFLFGYLVKGFPQSGIKPEHSKNPFD